MTKRNTVAFARKMQDLGYTQKQIRLVTKIPQSTLSRIMNKKTYVTIKPGHYEKDAELEKRFNTLKRLLKIQEIPGDIGLDKNNQSYIQLLKFIGVTKQQIKETYYDVSNRKINQVWNYNNISHLDFDSTIVQVTKEDYLDLVGGI